MLKSLLSAALTAIVLTTTGGATPVDPTVTYWRGWAVHGTHPYFQVWNPGPGRLCVQSMTVSSSVDTSAVALLMHGPLPTDISTWDPAAGKDGGYNAASPDGVDLDSQRKSQGQLRASVGTVQYGAQLWSVRFKANTPYTFRVRDCLAAGKGIGVRVGGGKYAQISFGARWAE